MNWTDQGVKNFKDSVDRAAAAEVALSTAGIKFKDLYWTVGTYDLIATLEAPDEETLAAALEKRHREGDIDSSAFGARMCEWITAHGARELRAELSRGRGWVAPRSGHQTRHAVGEVRRAPVIHASSPPPRRARRR
jgi:uncharacterized protein with GYD domain